MSTSGGRSRPVPPSRGPRGRSSIPGLAWVVLAVLAIAVIGMVGVLAWSIVSSAAASTPPTPGHRPAPTSSSAPAPRPQPSTSGEPSPSATSAPPAAAAEEARARLADVADGDGRTIAKYYREQFGQSWYDADRNGCDTRNDVLRRDLTDVVLKEGTNGCKVLSGTLDDPYTGERIAFQSGANTSADVQIDHIVPLSWAWRYGAERWTFEERMAFANDPANLLATGGAANQSKSDSGPSKWMPPDTTARCQYAEDWIGVLSTWKLTVGADDRRALSEALDTCF